MIISQYICVCMCVYMYVCVYLKSLCYIPKAYTLSYVNYSSKKRVGAWQRVGNKGKKANNTQGTKAGTPESWGGKAHGQPCSEAQGWQWDEVGSPCILFLDTEYLAPCLNFIRANRSVISYSMKGKQKSNPSPNANASFCIKRAFIWVLNWGQAQAARVSWAERWSLFLLKFGGQLCAGCGSEPILSHQRKAVI